MIKKALLTIVLLGCGGAATWWWQNHSDKPVYQQQLEQGYADMLSSLQEAESNLTSVLALAPPRSEQELIEGYRYLMGHLLREASSTLNNDPLQPRFERAVSFLSKWTGDNPDNAYLLAPLKPGESYRVSGAVSGYHGTQARSLADIPQAPGLVLFQTITHMIGDTGSLEELVNCRNQTFASLDSFSLQIDDKGRFEILLSPQKPEGYSGNWLATAGETECKHRDGSVSRDFKSALNFVVREIFVDWDEERPLELDIERIGYAGEPIDKVTAAQRARQMREIGEKVANQVKFWNGVMRLGLEAWGDFNRDGRRNLPINSLNPPAPPFLAGGTAGSRQLYASGMAELAEDEALVILVEMPIAADYLGFQLSNAWMESLDQANYSSSRNHSQLDFDRRGNTYLVVSHQDPGVHNWIDTTGLPAAQMTFRFWYREQPEAIHFPLIQTRKVKLNQVIGMLEYAGRPTPAERRAEIALRQRHIRQRFREY